MSDVPAPPSRSSWTRWASRLTAFADALETGGPDLQDRRIAALERRLAALEGAAVADRATLGGR